MFVYRLSASSHYSAWRVCSSTELEQIQELRLVLVQHNRSSIGPERFGDSQGGKRSLKQRLDDLRKGRLVQQGANVDIANRMSERMPDKILPNLAAPKVRKAQLSSKRARVWRKLGPNWALKPRHTLMALIGPNTPIPFLFIDSQGTRYTAIRI